MPVGADGTKNLDIGGCRTLEMNNDFLASAGREEATDGVFDVGRSANDGGACKKSPQPTEVRTSKILQPKAGIGDRSRHMECKTTLGFDRLDESGGRNRRGSKVIGPTIGTLEASPSR